MDVRARAVRWIGIGVGVGFFLALLGAWEDRRYAPVGFLITSLGCGAVAAVAFVVNETSRPFRLPGVVSPRPGAVRQRAIAAFTADGWTVTDTLPDSIAFARREGPNWGLTLLLFALGVVPGVLYLLLGGRTQTLAVLTAPERDGTRLQIVGSGSATGRAAAARFVAELAADGLPTDVGSAARTDSSTSLE